MAKFTGKLEQRRQRIISKARELYAQPSNDDLEIDDEPKLSRGDNGTWVAAWVWVDDRDLDA